jgi:hypothetical protein
VLERSTDGFSPAHRAALGLADALMTQPGQLAPELLAVLHEHFDHEQLVELTLDVMKWNYQKVSVALGTDRWLRPGELTDLGFDANGTLRIG